MRTIITFLNDKGLKAGTEYTWRGQKYEGGVFSLALRQFVEHDRMLVCNTPEAEKNTWPALSALNDARIEPVSIPKGETTAEMWEMFNTITTRVSVGETVIFDITHGLRSLPFLVFLFAAYLKSAKAVTIEAIYYGAFELGKPAPVIDLSEFVGILDWLTATNRFVETGDGQPLAELLRKGMPAGIEMRDDLVVRELGNNLRSAAQAIETISLALGITRPIETMESAVQLEATLEQAASSFDQRAKPFGLLAEQVAKEYGQFALENPKQELQLANNLWRQLQMITWYRERLQVVQAVTLAREWIISVLTLKFGEPMFDNRNGRKYVEDALNHAVERRKKEPRPIEPGRCDEQFESLPKADELADLWNKMTQLRNDIAHCGMNPSPTKAAKLKQNFENIYPKLPELAQLLLPQQVETA